MKSEWSSGLGIGGFDVLLVSAATAERVDNWGSKDDTELAEAVTGAADWLNVVRVVVEAGGTPIAAHVISDPG